MLAAAIGLAGVSQFATAGQAITQQAPIQAVTPVFDLNGAYTDGGSSRPIISNVNDILTVDMSSQGRPTAHGIVVNGDTILITFRDTGTHGAKLQAPGAIRWSDGTVWTRVSRSVPGVGGLMEAEAKSILRAAGFVIGLVRNVPDRTCTLQGKVVSQDPAAGTSAPPGTPVNLNIGVDPPAGC